MAKGRYITTNFWTDSKVVDDFTPEDRYIYLYCMTNPHTNLCGCYEVSIKDIAHETGYNSDSIERLLKRLDKAHDVIRYSAATKELLLLNWYRYNWSSSEKLNKPLLEAIRLVKCDRFREYLADRYNERENVTSRYDYEIDSRYPVDVEEEEDITPPADVPAKPRTRRKEAVRHKHGEYGWVRLSDEEYSHLLNDLGPDELARCIAYVDESAQATSNKNKWSDWNLVVRKCSRGRWGLDRSGAASPRPSKAEGAMDDMRALHEMFSEEGAP